MIRKKVEAGKKPRLIFSDMEMPQHTMPMRRVIVMVTILKVEMCPGREKMK